MARNPLVVDVALAPMLLRREPERMARSVYIVVDVIRATTTLCVLFERGCRQVEIAGSVAAARQAARHRRTMARLDESLPILAGEIGGLAPPDFDHGNSPAEFAALNLRERKVIFATTNGTRALHACVGGGAVLVGAFRNATAVAQAAVAQVSQIAVQARMPLLDDASSTATGDGDDVDGPAIIVVCAGRDQHPAFDDTICAGYLARCVEDAAASNGIATTRTNGARIASAAAQTALRDGPRAALAVSDAAHAIVAVGLEDDLDWCAEVDACALVPAVTREPMSTDLLVVRPWTAG